MDALMEAKGLATAPEAIATDTQGVRGEDKEVLKKGSRW
jgi:hypothetical protein